VSKDLKKTKTIRAGWKNSLDMINDNIEDLVKRVKEGEIPEDDQELVGLLRDREVHELEIEGWSIALAQQDPDQASTYLAVHLDDIVSKINDAKSRDGSSGGSTTTKSSR